MKWKIAIYIVVPFHLAFLGCSSFLYLHKPPVFKTAIAISVKELTEKIKSDVDSNIPIPIDLMNFCGMNRLFGYAIDEKNNDIILIGARMEPSRDMTIDDFAVAMRNAWLETTPPGCSIDPQPKEIESLRNLMETINRHPDEFVQDRILSKWKKSAEFSSVRILGISRNTSFAKAIVEADYLMKKISDGSHSIRVRGFKSFNQMMLEADEIEFRKRGVVEQKEILCRFWFCPDENRFWTTTNALYLKNSSVKLLTEEEYWNGKERIGKGNAHPVAEEFVKTFSLKYRAISNREPVYSLLETLIRMVVIQKLLKDRNDFNPIKNTLDFWLYRYPINPVLTQDSVQSIYNYDRLYSTIDDRRVTILSPMAGGVVISPILSDSCFVQDRTGFVAGLRNLAINSRPKEKSVYWYFDLPESVLIQIFEN
jgi:hypothetical protein